MNLKYQLLVAAAALSLGACSTDDTGTEPENEGYKISFTVAEDAETRTTLDKGADGRDYLLWVPTDKVGIYTVGKNENPNTLTVADVNQHPVEFIGVLKKLVSSGDMFYAYYPYDATQSTNPSSVTLSIPAEQKQTKAGVYNGESHPLVALPMEFTWEQDSYAGRISSVRFRQLGATVELQLYSSNEALRSEKIRSVTFESETPLAGDFSFNLTSVTVDDELKISGYESKVATTSLEEPAAIPATASEAARIYLTIAPGTYTGKIVVKTDVTQYTFRLAEAMTFGRAAIKGLPADLAEATREAPVTENDVIHFEDPVVKGICIDNWDDNSDGELSYKEAAAVTSIGSLFNAKLIRSFNELQYFTGLQSIENNAFSYSQNLTSLHIPNGVTTIGKYAFEGCSSLTNIHIPDGVTAIYFCAFMNCSSLKSIDIPESVTVIDIAFQGCSSLTSITIPDGVTWIGNYGFENCSSLTSINLPEGLTSIGIGVFKNCSNLTSIHIPETVTTIESSAFQGCSKLTSINLPNGLTTIKDSAFRDCSNLTSITIPEGVTTIENNAFYYCSSLTSITIPEKVSSIGKKVFVGCSSLSAFYGKYASKDNRYLIKYGSLLAFASAGLTDYTIPDEVVGIGNYAFYDCSSLKSITIPDGVISIGYMAFRGCNMSIYCKPTIPPTVEGGDVFPWSVKIYVPTASVEAYKTAEGWSSYASLIVADNLDNN